MSVNFSTIRPMDPSTVSRQPKYSVDSETPVASVPIGSEPEKKKSHWFLKTVGAVVVLAGAAALLRGKVDAFKEVNIFKPIDVTTGAKVGDKVKYWGEMAMYYGKCGVAYVGDFVNKYCDKAVTCVKGLLKFGAPAK